MRWFRALAAFLSVSGPPVGSKYEGCVKLPMVGTQDICLHILSNEIATIHLKGFVTMEDQIQYSIIDDRFEFVLGEQLQRKMNRLRSEIRHAHYDKLRDVAAITLHIKPLFYSRKVLLKRSVIKSTTLGKK